MNQVYQMNYKVRYTPQSVRSLNELIHFYSQKLPYDKVLKIQEHIVLKINTLEVNPFRDQVEFLLANIEKGHRRLVVSKYIKVIYLIRDDVIIITDIFDTRRDPNKMKT
jgi:toxin ParE1/3/4